MAESIVLLTAGLILLAYCYDTRRRHSIGVLLGALLSGFAAMSLIGVADDAALGLPGLRGGSVTRSAIVALIEESGKLVCIATLAKTFYRRRIVEPLDGLLIGQMVGLGMAVNESILYLHLQPQTLQTLGMEVIRLFAHSLMAGVIGFGVGAASSDRLPPAERQRCLLLCVCLTTTIHFSWNAIAYARQVDLPAHLMPMILMLTLMLLWKTFCNIAQRHAGDAWPITTAPLQTA